MRLKKSVPGELTKYENRDTSEILAIVVRCTYTIDDPLTNKRATETFDFYLHRMEQSFILKKGERII